MIVDDSVVLLKHIMLLIQKMSKKHAGFNSIYVLH